jgi:hypothetical protein
MIHVAIFVRYAIPAVHHVDGSLITPAVLPKCCLLSSRVNTTPGMSTSSVARTLAGVLELMENIYATEQEPFFIPRDSTGLM